MVKRKIFKVKPMTGGKHNIIAGLLQEYDIQTKVSFYYIV